jgi:hypothetical protein
MSGLTWPDAIFYSIAALSVAIVLAALIRKL